MKFGPVDVSRAQGAILAHSVRAGALSLRKGVTLSQEDIAALAAAGLDQVTVAVLEPGDIGEDAAARAVAARMIAPGITATEAFTGRVNLVAAHDGLFRVDAAAVAALNAVDEGITLATLADCSRVQAGALLATVKIIPYAVAGTALQEAIAILAESPVALLGNTLASAALVLTETPGLAPKLTTKAEAVTRARMDMLGVTLSDVHVVPHTTSAVAQALQKADGDMLLIMGGSATSDRADVAPSGLLQAGGRIDRFGMPVDPGNLLFTGQLAGRPVVGLPGCARSPALNGADWVLERLVAGLDVPGPEIAAMGVGGLLKEIPQRAQPRRAPRRKGAQLEIVLLAAGAARRMRGQDKLLRPVSSQVPLLAHSARAAVAAGLGKVHVVVPLGNEARKSALEGIPVNVVETAAWQLGMAHSLRAGLAEVSAQAAGAIVALADMPDVGAAHFKALAAAFNPEGGAEIRRSVTATGAAGHPVLFSRRFFESLADLDGDRGARDILKSSPEMVVDVSTPGEGAVVDLDTPEAWAAWETRQPGA